MKDVLKTTEEKMQKSVNVLDADYKSIRAGRANPGVLDKISVDYYGTETPVNQVAAISVSEARVLVIQPWDASMLKALEKAIQTSDSVSYTHLDVYKRQAITLGSIWRRF